MLVTHALCCALGLHAVCAQGQEPCEVRAWLAANGREADPGAVALEQTDGATVARFEAPADGTYSVGVALVAPSIMPLAPGLQEYSAEDLDEPLTLPYPYDWTYAEKRNILNLPRLAMPGVVAGGSVYLIDTHDLSGVRLAATEDGRVRALLLAHRYYNDGADAATPELKLQAGDRVELRVQVFDSLPAANLARFGEGRDISGTMMQVAYRGWTATEYGAEQYGKIAAACAGVYDWVIVREIGTHDWLPPIFHERGIPVMAYQYLGALRRYSAQVTEATEATLGMPGSGGALYTAPYSPDAPWLLADIRRPEVREVFVRRAVEAIEAGFDGIFLDGTNFFTDDTGRRGGNLPQAEHSLAWAHWKLLAEIREAVHDADADAILGVLGNDPYDALGEADFVLKERMYFGWEPFGPELAGRNTRVSMEFDIGFETGEAPLTPKLLVYGVKGYSSIAVQTALHFVRNPTGLWYLGTGDHRPETLDEWIEVIVAHATEDLYVTTIDPPDRVLHFEGRDTVWADEDCRIELSRPACLAADGGGRTGAHGTAFHLEAERKYRILRECPEEG